MDPSESPVEAAFEALRKKSDVRIVTLGADETYAGQKYRCTVYWWPGSGAQRQLAVTGDTLLEVVTRADEALTKEQAEVA